MMATPGNLFLLITLPELRRQGLTYLAFYALQRAADEREYSEYWLRSETGLPDYETSRACKLLAESSLARISRSEEDGRMRILRPTPLGRRVLARIISTAASRLMDGIPTFGRSRRLDEAAAFLHQASNRLLGQFQLSFFDTDEDETPPRQRRKKRPKRANRTALAQKRPKAVASLLEQV